MKTARKILIVELLLSLVLAIALPLSYFHIKRERSLEIGIRAFYNEDYKRAKEFLLNSEIDLSNNAEALFVVGQMYELGKAGLNSLERSYDCYYNAATNHNYNAAKIRLGIMIAERRITKWREPAEELKFEWLLAAANDGHVDAQCDIGFYYNSKEDYIKAAEWFHKAAEQDNVIACSELGQLYLNGHGVAKSLEKARQYQLKAAEQGNASAQNNLGAMYADGKGVLQSYTEAVKWYRKAAEQGNATAQYNLGRMYRYGYGVSQSGTEAVKWYRKAADQEHSDAKWALEKRY